MKEGYKVVTFTSEKGTYKPATLGADQKVRYHMNKITKRTFNRGPFAVFNEYSHALYFAELYFGASDSYAILKVKYNECPVWYGGLWYRFRTWSGRLEYSRRVHDFPEGTQFASSVLPIELSYTHMGD